MKAKRKGTKREQFKAFKHKSGIRDVSKMFGYWAESCRRTAKRAS